MFEFDAKLMEKMKDDIVDFFKYDNAPVEENVDFLEYFMGDSNSKTLEDYFKSNRRYDSNDAYVSSYTYEEYEEALRFILNGINENIEISNPEEAEVLEWFDLVYYDKVKKWWFINDFREKEKEVGR